MKHDPKKEQMWRDLIKSYSDSNMSIKKYCEQHNVKEYQFYYWQKKFKQNQPSKHQPSIKTPTFIEVKTDKSRPVFEELSIEISGIKIHVPTEFNASHLRKILKVIKNID